MKATKSTYISRTVRELKPSGIRRFFDLAAGMEGVISLGVGEPDFVTPWHVREAAIRSIEEGYTSYTPNAGLLELREEITNYVKNRYHVEYSPSEVIVTVGASSAIDTAMRTIIDPGDEVIVVEPCFVSYSPTVTLAGGIPVPVQALKENDFKILPSQIEAAITHKTKAMIICFPNNPTGTLLNRTELEALAEIAKKYDLLVISDEIYAELTYDDSFTSMASLPSMRERTILVNGFSKAFAMTGWRLGYVCAPEEIASAMLKVHQYALMCASTNSQYAGLEALRNGQGEVEKMVKSYRLRRNFIVNSFNEMGLTCHMPGGAFYAFPSIESTGLSSQEFAERLLLEQSVAVVPGDVFGESGEGHIRCSYATSMEELKEAMKRIKRFIDSL
ncbi:aminotransferase [Ureibacillus thermosphaericus]|jgi:aminotransferase|uniref:Aminotransferase n=1 Tax=Ureibacillus thermosphaericus TaxID=51173 RepID=A0A840PS18_URETH|nr:aminotransferase [Ureibacillus thermosphaericus]MBB5147954.1 aminotransferase [Ureibacillus thermosphaericus]NKZ30668.1 aminotransferase [Ureibacillus thermosphaericus]